MTDPDRKRVAPVFLNLSNHPLSTWTPEQLEAARELGLGEPTDLEGGMPLVPAEAGADEVAELAREIADRAIGQGAAAAHVATEHNLTVALVRELQARGVRCFAATTEREVEERGMPNGEMEKRAVFRFRRWREYV
ncbi:MAG: CRISPR-associated protein [Polyangia bacterium]